MKNSFNKRSEACSPPSYFAGIFTTPSRSLRIFLFSLFLAFSFKGMANPCTDPSIPTLGVSANPICSGSPTMLSIQSGNLNDATNWFWYSGSCNGTAVGSGASVSVSPAGTTTYYVRGEGGCVVAGTCATITVTVQDNQPPVLTCGAPVVNVSNGAGQCSAVVNLSTPGVTDNCGMSVPVLDVSQTTANNTWNTGGYNVGQIFNAGLTGVLSKVSLWIQSGGTGSVEIRDGGNYCAPLLGSTSATFTPGWNDFLLTGVNVIAGNQYTLNVNSSNGTVINLGPNIPGGAINWSSCGNSAGFAAMCFKTYIGAVPLTNDHLTNIFPVGSTTVTWTATDAAGNVSTCSQVVNVSDLELPVITCGSGVTAIADPGQCTATINLTAPIATDNCNISPVIDQGQQTVNNTWTTGGYNVAQVFTAGITGPMPKISLNFQSGGTGTVELRNGGDYCAPLIWSAPATFTTGWNDYTLTGINVTAGNLYTINVLSSSGTVINLGPAIPGSAVNWGSCSNSTNAFSFTFKTYVGAPGIVSSHPSSSYSVGTTTVTWTATDIHGNSSTCTQSVTVTDNEAPVITCPANVSLFAAAGNCTQTFSIADPINDNCTGAVWNASFSGNANGNPANVSGISDGANSSVITFQKGTTTVTLSGEDGSGNPASACSFTVTVTDNLPPVLTCGAPVINVNASPGQCSAVVNLSSPAVTDNCGMSVAVLDVSQPTANNTWFTGGYNVGQIFNAGMTGVLSKVSLWIQSGGTGSVEIRDGGNYCAPLLGSTPATFTPGWNDFLFTGVNVIAGNTYTLNVNSSNGTIINLGPNIPGGAINWSSCGNSAGFAAMCFKTYIGAVPLTSDQLSNNFPVGSTTVTWTATDAAGNVSTCSQMVVVSDLELPAITCGSAVSVNTDAGQCSATVNLVAPVATDNCDISPVIDQGQQTANNTWSTNGFNVGQIFTAGLTGPMPKISVNFQTGGTGTIELRNGGTYCAPILWSAPATFTAGWNDFVLTGINVTAGNLYTINILSSNGTIVNLGPAIPGSAVTWSSCGNSTNAFSFTFKTYVGAPGVVSSHPSATYPVGTTTVTWTATDIHGNSNTCTQRVTVTDNEAPVIACPSDIISCTPVVTYSPSATDNCNIASVVCTPASGSTFAVGATPVTCHATDVNGNTSTNCTFNVTVQAASTAATSATSNALYGQVCSPSSVTLTANGGSLGTGASWVWYDGACGGVSVGSGATLTLTPSVGSHNYFVRAEGTCGNTACQSVAVSVITAPPTGTIHYTASITDGCVGAPAATFSVNTIPTCTFYNWSSTASGVRFNGNPSPFQTTTPTVNVTFVGLPAAGTSGWSICVFGGNACGNTNTICTWVRATISAPTSIAGSVIGCPGTTGNPYSSSAVAGAVSYQWSSTGGIVVNNNGSQAITVDFPAGFVSGSLTVNGQTSCGYNGPTKTININRAPATPGTIVGSSYPCPNSLVNAYSVTAVPGAANYTWSTTVPGAVVTGTTNSCNIQFPVVIPAGSSVSVVANSSCPFSSAVRSKGISSGIPNTPAAISGPALGQCGQTGVSYTITPVTLATGYNWSTTCGTLVGPTNLSGVTVDWPASFTTCTLSVSATNACGTGTARILGVAGAPATPGNISGNAAPCANSTEAYSTSGSAGATSYIWTIPAGAVILGPTNGASILVQWGATSGSITVRGSNACGNSAVRSLPCVISCRMSQVNSSSGSFNAEVYPNPVTQKATLKFTAASTGHFNMNMTDMLGHIVLSTDVVATEGMNMIELNLSAFAKGVYMLSISGDDGSRQVRVVVD